MKRLPRLRQFTRRPGPGRPAAAVLTAGGLLAAPEARA